MIKEITVRKYGGSLGVTLPKAMMDRLALAVGAKAYARETAEGILITPYSPDFQQLVEAEEEFSAQYRNALRELAK